MSVKFFAPGKHPDGFIGFQVVAEQDGQPRIEYFSTATASEQNDSNVIFLQKKLQANLLDATIKAEALEKHYKLFVSTNSPECLPYRGTGVHCIEMNYIKHGSEMRPVFQVIDDKGRRHSVGFEALLFSEAWAATVTNWAKIYGIEEKDAQRVTENPPQPTAFRDLRRQMNEEGHNILVDSISVVFTEAKQQREQEAAAKKGAQAKMPSAPAMDDAEAGGMLTWLEEQKEMFTKGRQ